MRLLHRVVTWHAGLAFSGPLRFHAELDVVQVGGQVFEHDALQEWLLPPSRAHASLKNVEKLLRTSVTKYANFANLSQRTLPKVDK